MVKPVKKRQLRNVDGIVVDYGPIVAGRISGTHVYARREVLLSLGVSFVGFAVRDFLETRRVRVKISGVLEASIYVRDYKDLDDAVYALANRGFDSFIQKLDFDSDRKAIWVRHFALKPSEGVTYRRGPLSRWTRLWLLVKRLFGKEETTVLVPKTDNSELDELLKTATKKAGE